MLQELSNTHGQLTETCELERRIQNFSREVYFASLGFSQEVYSTSLGPEINLERLLAGEEAE